ncbi:hypothetical protein HK102_007930 [Quaeritorhiza haematococci]|nr:hypothetical protein HK102_007930 [Quaeritorhiza haematococci]
MGNLVRTGARAIMTGKHGNKNYYKGTGGGRLGHWSLKGRYRIDPWRLRSFIVPDLSNSQLKPYVSPEADNTIRRTHSFIDYFAYTDEEIRAQIERLGTQGEGSSAATPTLKYLMDEGVLISCREAAERAWVALNPRMVEQQQQEGAVVAETTQS